MKQFYILGYVLFISFLKAQTIAIPNANLKARLLSATPASEVAKDINNQSIAIDVNANGEIEISEAEQVYSLNVANAFITTISGLEFFPNLKSLNCGFNQITSLNVSNMPQLEQLFCTNNQMTLLNVSGLANLYQLSCVGNQLTNIDFSGLSSLKIFDCRLNAMTSLNVTSLSSLETLWCDSNQLTSLNVEGLPDLVTLNCSYNQLSELNLASLPNIQVLDCSFNQLTSLDLEGLTLWTVICANNQLSNLILSDIPTLQRLYCQNNQLTSLDLSGFDYLSSLNYSYNQMPDLDLSPLSNTLHILSCSGNQISTIDLSSFVQLSILECSGNPIETLDLMGTAVGKLSASNNPNLKYILLKNGIISEAQTNLLSLTMSNLPQLEYVCGDPEEILYIGSVLAGSFISAYFGSYCSFVPGGIFYNATITQQYDMDGNGCSSSDIGTFEFIHYSINDGTAVTSVIETGSEGIGFPLQAGTHTIIPELENPDYFMVTPESVTFTIPSENSTYSEHFCISANGVHPDLEVSLIPLIAAVPGFAAHYQIIVRNKGNVAQSGTVTLNFEDALMDFESDDVLPTLQSESLLSWDFTDLLPFESRTFNAKFILNTPTENPAVNNGDVLDFSASVSISPAEETESDNVANLAQTVVGSYDPNDKTCLEGSVVGQDIIGTYVHYMIRFENEGTANAQNIVVRDDIDLSRYDVNSLVPISASDNFSTRITDNKVEFIFQNIQLPFDDASNDGYVAFKIKTLPTLQVGDTFENSASIYFDYNYPVVTQPAVTIIEELSVGENDQNKSLTIYPNPARNSIRISTSATSEIKSVKIYSVTGQHVLSVSNPDESSLDISRLRSGTYFVKAETDAGSAVAKLIKQ